MYNIEKQKRERNLKNYPPQSLAASPSIFSCLRNQYHNVCRDYFMSSLADKK